MGERQLSEELYQEQLEVLRNYGQAGIMNGVIEDT
jgi:hypothetical protein